MPQPSATTGLRRHAALIARGVGGASTLALLALGGAIGLFAGADAAPAVAWLSGLGMNALAGWLDGWARANLAQALGDERDAEGQLLARLAQDLEAHLAGNTALAGEAAALVEQTQAIAVALDALQGQGEAQRQLLQALLDEAQQGAARNTQLHALTLQAVQAQAAALRTVVMQGDHALYGMLQQLLERVSTPAPAQWHEQTIAGQAQVGVAISGDFHGTLHVHAPEARVPPLSPIDPAAALALLAAMPTDTVPEVAALPTPHRMPQRRNPQFVGRAPDLRALAAALKSGGVAAITTGIGGVGKTQLAAEVAFRYGQYFAGGVFWLSFADPSGIEGEIAACGGPGALELYRVDEGLTQPEQVARVYAAWEQPTPRLLIFDNCDDMAGRSAEQQLAARLPRGGGCRVLVTSRRGQWSTELGVAAHPLGMLPRAESLALLRAYCGDLADADADLIAAELGDLPLALTLAGRYLESYRAEGFGRPATYLAALQAQRLNHRSLVGGGSAPGRTDGVRAAFALSFARLDPAQPIDALAIAALARAACLAPSEPFPRALLTDRLVPDAGAQEDAADALQRLVALGLLEQSGADTLKIHRLVSAYATAACADAQAQPAVEQALTDMGNALVNDGFPAALSPLLAHLRHGLAAAGLREDAAVAALANAAARAEQALLNYAAARPLYERALGIREQALGPLHPDTATSLNNLAALLRAQGDYAAARPLYERALGIREQALGPLHPDTATSLNNLAALLRAQGDYAAARPLYERALGIREQALGPLHPDTATSLNNLAMLLRAQGDYAAARPLYERALAIWEQALGPLHPSTATSLNNLAELYESQGDDAAARPLYERALAIWEQALGPLHPSTATSLNNLAELYESQGDYAAARPLYERALGIREQALGPLHPSTATSLNNLAGLYESQGDYAAARPLYERALGIREQALGPLHPDTATSLNNLAALLRAQGDYAAARPLYERALGIREQALGPLHPDTATSLNNLAMLLRAQGDYAAARPLYERALAIREQALGPLHPSTATSLNNLAELYESQGDDAAARPLYERALAIWEQALGPLHPSTATSLNNLAELYESQGDYAAARPLYERALGIREQALGPLHPSTATSLNNLAGLYESQGDYAAARPLYERALAICMARLGPDHPTTRIVHANLAALGTSPRSAEQQIATITAQAEAAVEQATAGRSIDRAALAQQLEAQAQWAEDGEAAGSPYLALAATLRTLAARL